VLDPTSLFVCRACSTAWRWKSSTQPDGGEGLAKRKGVTGRWGLKEAWSKRASRWTKTGYEAYCVGRAGK
jgi:predicted metal-binding protein